MGLLIRLIVQSIAVFLTAYLLPGVMLDGYGTAILVALVLGILNAIVKPVLTLLTLPLTILTLGLFTFVINAIVIELVDFLVDGFSVGGFFNALLFSLVLSLISGILHALVRNTSD